MENSRPAQPAVLRRASESTDHGWHVKTALDRSKSKFRARKESLGNTLRIDTSVKEVHRTEHWTPPTPVRRPTLPTIRRNTQGFYELPRVREDDEQQQTVYSQNQFPDQQHSQFPLPEQKHKDLLNERTPPPIAFVARDKDRSTPTSQPATLIGSPRISPTHPEENLSPISRNSPEQETRNILSTIDEVLTPFESYTFPSSEAVIATKNPELAIYPYRGTSIDSERMDYTQYSTDSQQNMPLVHHGEDYPEEHCGPFPDDWTAEQLAEVYRELIRPFLIWD